MSEYLAPVVRPNATIRVVKSDDECPSNPWESNCPYETMKYPTQWMNPSDGTTVTCGKGTPCIGVGYRFRKGGGPWEDQDGLLIGRYPSMANGWTKEDLDEMNDFLGARPVILDGLLRLIPMKAEYMKNQRTVNATRRLLERAEGHIKAGRLPILKDQTKSTLLERANAHEIASYGKPLATLQPAKKRQDRGLFD